MNDSDFNGWPWNARSYIIYCMTLLRSRWLHTINLIWVSILIFQPADAQGKNPPSDAQGGWVPPPWILVFPSEFFKNISHGYVFGVKESNGDNEKFLFLLHDLENQGQTPFCMTFHISGCKHDTMLILVSILTFSRSRISKMLKTIPWPWRLTLEFKVTTHSLYDLH